MREDKITVTRLFRMQEPLPGDKSIEITGPDTFSMRIDYDDVDHDAVLAHARKMVRLLNTHWNG